MTKFDDYRTSLAELPDWIQYLEENSNLPGPRANLELAYAAGLVADFERALELIQGDLEKPAGDFPQVFPILCGVISLARQSGKNAQACDIARQYACDHRWRLREAVAIGLQFRGDTDPNGLLQLMSEWVGGNLYEQRCVVAALCEPRLLKDDPIANQVIGILDQISRNLHNQTDRKSDEFRVLRQALGYGWSVVIVAAPQTGKMYFENWLKVDDGDIRWIVRENLKKNRLIKLDPKWVKSCSILIA